ncbi:TPA: hypothetical protein ACH3X3_004931 [Trebouxia sp. C0006]
MFAHVLPGDQWCNDGKALQAYVRDQRSVYEQHSHKQPDNYVPFCSVPHFRAVFQAWANKMDRQWLFRCPKCGGAPPVVVGGATAESIQKRLYCGQSVTEFQAGSVPQARPDTRAEQCLLAAAADRR